MWSLTPDLFVLAGLLAMLASLFLGTIGLHRNRRVRTIKRKITDRLLSWGK